MIWGGLHGLYLVVFHAWRRAIDTAWPTPAPAWMAPATRGLAWLVTFTAVVVAWVFFRATDLSAALSMLRSMAGVHGAVLPDQIIGFVPPLAHLAQGVGKVPYLADGSVMGCVEMALMLAIGLVLALAAPTLPSLRNRWRYALVVPCGALALQRVIYGHSSEFLYFQF